MAPYGYAQRTVAPPAGSQPHKLLNTHLCLLPTLPRDELEELWALSASCAPPHGALFCFSYCIFHKTSNGPLLQARTRKLAEKRIPKAELEELERRRAAEEADDRKGMVKTMRCAVRCALLQLNSGDGQDHEVRCALCIAQLNSGDGQDHEVRCAVCAVRCASLQQPNNGARQLLRVHTPQCAAATAQSSMAVPLCVYPTMRRECLAMAHLLGAPA